nr:MAG TPA: tail protein [Caudoviricetes sp.]
MTSALINEKDELARNWSAPARLTGNKGDKGEQGSQGIAGTSQYIHIRYSANPDGNPMSTEFNKYIGMAVTNINQAPIDPAAYSPWKEFVGQQGATGEQGIQGPAGPDGKPTFFHVKYSNDNGLTFTPGRGESGDPDYLAPGETPGDYMGTYADYIELDSEDVNDYKWARIKGDKGEKGEPGGNGRIIYPMGSYDDNTVYECTDAMSPYVLFEPNGTYYAMNKTYVWQGIVEQRTPAEDYNAHGQDATWVPMEKYQAIYTDLLIADGGKLGSFVFGDNKMFSQ